MKTALCSILLLVVVVALVLLTPEPMSCVQCPKLSDGSCAGVVYCAAPGKPSQMGVCETVVKSNGRLDCKCSLRK